MSIELLHVRLSQHKCARGSQRTVPSNSCCCGPTFPKYSVVKEITSPTEYIAQTIRMLRRSGADQMAISTVMYKLRHDPPRNLLCYIQLTNELLDQANIRTSTELASVDGMIARMMAMVYRNPSLDD